ncbi:hypothetical protein KAR91_15245 [Candidatus Pacearchaeota archaeon]|nr:hypothetical protein [Candidatus Pacearchaeota archaeon]
MTNKIKQLESAVKDAIYTYLEMKRYHWWPVNNVGIYDPTKKIYRKPKEGHKKGVPDVEMLHNGQYYAIELKSSVGKQTKDQIEFQKKTEANGGIYLLVRKVDDLINIGL